MTVRNRTGVSGRGTPRVPPSSGGATGATGATGSTGVTGATGATGPNFQYFYFGGDAGTYSAGNDFLLPWMPNGTAAANEQVLATVTLMKSGTLRNMRVFLVGAGTVSGSSAVFTTRQNQANTALAVTIAVAGSSGSDLVNTLAIAAGDDIAVTIDATTLGSVVWVSYEFYPDP